jgi:hypothetical protein
MRHKPVLPLGRAAWNWIREGGKPTRIGWSQLLMQRWQNLWFERSLSLQRNLPTARNLSEDPLFILGVWRSGTTYLHDLLSSCPGIGFPANWQCMGPASFRLQSPPIRGTAVQRPMDRLLIHNLSPQEDEFALLALGVPSVYRGFFDPRRLLELTQWLDPDNWAKERPPGWIESWQQFLTGVAEGTPGRLVLKSPNHSYRINALTEMFPNASYIWLTRDPLETFFSNQKMWLAMFELYALWAWDPSILDEFLAQAFQLAAESLDRATRLLPKEKLVVVPFGQLTQSTLATLQALNGRLPWGNWEAMQPALTRFVTGRAAHRSGVYPPAQLPKSVLVAVEKLRLAQQAALASHGL